jgi:hypothetical protein
MRLVLVAALLFCGCGKKEDGHKADPSMLAPLKAMWQDYRAWSDDFLAPRKGWVTGGCDDVKFTGLRGIYAPEVDLTAALKSPGEWTRRDLALGDCYEMRNEKGERLSQSRTSRDMALGEAWWMARNNRTDLAKDVVHYVEKHDWKLGDGDVFRTDIRPALYATFLQIAKIDTPAAYTPVVVGGTDYERENNAWHIELRAQIGGGMPDGYFDWIRLNATEQAHNPLYQYQLARWVTGDYAPFVAAAMNAQYYPRDHLPDSTNYCADWVMQRDMGKDWQPCPSEEAFKQWSGSDWLAVVALALAQAD